jgi:hypothetical protein
MAQHWDTAKWLAGQVAGRAAHAGVTGACAAGSFVARTGQVVFGASDPCTRESVQLVSFGVIDAPGSQQAGSQVPVALLGYATGWQVWALDEAGGPSELVSRRDGPVWWAPSSARRSPPTAALGRCGRRSGGRRLPPHPPPPPTPPHPPHPTPTAACWRPCPARARWRKTLWPRHGRSC